MQFAHPEVAQPKLVAFRSQVSDIDPFRSHALNQGPERTLGCVSEKRIDICPKCLPPDKA